MGSGWLEGVNAAPTGRAADTIPYRYLWPGYKTGAGLDPAIASQFHPLEHTLRAAGFRVFAMVEYEADDALGSAAQIAAADPRVDRVVICTPDKDLGQCVTADGRVVQLDRRKGEVFDHAGVTREFGVPPASIPDYLGLVGDTADGFPGLPGWGAKTAATLLARYGHIEAIPPAEADWDVSVRGAARLAATLREHRADALLFRRIATIAADAPTIATVDELAWRGPTPDFERISVWLDDRRLADRARRIGAR